MRLDDTPLPADQSNERQVRTLVENWARAVREGDLEGVLACHAPDILLFDVPPPLQSKGLKAYRKAWELFFSFQPSGGFDLEALEIAASDTVAYGHSLVRVGDEPAAQVRLTIGLRKIGGRWLIAHEHHSAPIEAADG